MCRVTAAERVVQRTDNSSAKYDKKIAKIQMQIMD